MSIEPVRGHVYRMIDDEYGILHCLIVSVFPAFETDSSCLAARVTMTPRRHDFPGWVRMMSGDPGRGYVVTHDLDRVDIGELKDDRGALSADTMFQVERALKRMLGL